MLVLSGELCGQNTSKNIRKATDEEQIIHTETNVTNPTKSEGKSDATEG